MSENLEVRPESSGRRRALSWGAIFLLVLASHAWMTGLWFGLDDFDFLPECAGPPVRDSYLMGGRPPLSKGAIGPAYAFVLRPSLHISLWIDQALFGTDARALHASSVAWHLLTCILLFELVLRVARTPWRDSAAFATAAVFAVHPAKLEAVSWISTRGDLLAGCFGVAAALALIGYRRRPGALRLLAYFAAIAATVLAKESGAIVVVALVLADLILRGPSRSARLASVGVAIATVVAYAGWRRIRLGDDMLVYAGQSRIMTPGIAVEMAQRLPTTVRNLWAGSFLEGVRDQPFMTVAALAFALALVVLLVSATRSMRVAALSGLGLSVLTLLPALRFLEESSSVDLSRLFYVPALPAAFLAGLLLAFVSAGRGLSRLAVAACLVVVMVANVHAFAQEVKVQRAAARTARAVVARVEEAVRGLPAGTCLLVEDVPATVGSAPCLGGFLEMAIRPPFRGETLNVRVRERGAFFARGEHMLFSEALQFARWDQAREALVLDGALLDPPQPLSGPLACDGLPAVVLTDIAPRSVSRVVFELDRPDTGAALDVEFHMSSGAIRQERLQSRLATGAPRLRLLLADQEWFMGERRLVKLVMKGDPAGPRVHAVRFEAEVPLVLWQSPPPGTTLSLSGPEPLFEFRCTERYPLWRLSIQAGGTIEWFFSDDQAAGNGSDLRRWSRSRGIVPCAAPGEELDWERMKPFIRAHLDREALGHLDLHVRLYAHDCDPDHPVDSSWLLWLKVKR